MGKFQSKHVCKRREGPEGGSFAAHALTCQRESERTGIHINKIKSKQELCQGELKEEPQLDQDCHLEVALPPERASDQEHSSHLPANKHPRRRNSHADDAECNVVLDDDARQEWVFTLYDFDNSGKITKEDMSSLMHSIYEVVEASVKQPCSSTTALRLKLVLTPSTSTDQEQSVVQEVGSPARRPYCVDENTERRNHYLDLAGIENYSSKFDDADSPSQESRQDARPALQRRSVVAGENCSSTESRGRGLSFLRSFRGKAKAVAGDRAGGGAKSARFHGQHQALWCHPTQLQLQAHVPLQRTHSKRLRPRLQDAGSPSRPPCSQGQPRGERETVPGLHASCGGLAAPTQRHEHHHEHHHHHHHHHYHPS